jgi:hypothetical protein
MRVAEWRGALTVNGTILTSSQSHSPETNWSSLLSFRELLPKHK